MHYSVSKMIPLASKQITPVRAKPSPARILRSVGLTEVAPAGTFQEEVRKAVLRWINRGDNTGFSFAENGAVVFYSTIGKRNENQDRTLFLRLIPQKENWPITTALILCDGMGGMKEGATAAELAVSSFVAAFSASKSDSLVEQLRSATETANEEVFRRFSGKGGATLSAIGATNNGEWACVNVGDSRVYGYLVNGEVKQISTDDSLGNVLSGMEVATPSPQFRELLQYVGMGKGIQVHGIELLNPEIYNCLFLTSDGAHEIDQQLFKDIVVSAGSPKEIARRLTIVSDWKGGNDNATVAAWAVNTAIINEFIPEDRGYLEVWGLSGKFEIASRHEPRLSMFQGKDSEPYRPTRRRSSPAKQTKKTSDTKKSNSTYDELEITHDLEQSYHNGTDSIDTSIVQVEEPQLQIEILEA
jgi:serine/threonine protein phosphatase PrpC